MERVCLQESGLGGPRADGNGSFYDEEIIREGFVEARKLALMSPEEAAYEASFSEEEKLPNKLFQYGWKAGANA
jgi:hypothetical protein